jgi:mono/diheme cytochrome c family protein
VSRYPWTALSLALLLVAFAAAGCSRGVPHEERQVVIIPDMEVQKKFWPQGYTPLFEDQRMMRRPVTGTVARGTMRADSALYAGREDGVFVARAPVSITRELMARGRERFNVFCAPCHDRTGGGQGMVAVRGNLVPAPKFWEDRIVAQPDGHIFDVITNGIRTMPAYGRQIPPRDRWAVVAYVRALQRAQTATVADVPSAMRGEIR